MAVSLLVDAEVPASSSSIFALQTQSNDGRPAARRRARPLDEAAPGPHEDDARCRRLRMELLGDARRRLRQPVRTDMLAHEVCLLTERALGGRQGSGRRLKEPDAARLVEALLDLEAQGIIEFHNVAMEVLTKDEQVSYMQGRKRLSLSCSLMSTPSSAWRLEPM